MDKQELLSALAQKRKVTRWPGYSCIGDYHDGASECDFVSPFTTTAGNVDAEIFVLLQDWSSDDNMRGPLDPSPYRLFPTDKRLDELLQSCFGMSLGETFGTNLFPFVKMGGVSSSIPFQDLVRAASDFALPQIRIVQPKLVVCLGLNTFNALRVACGHQPTQPMELAIASPFSFDNSRIWCQAHTGARGQNNRGRERVVQDWLKMKADFSRSA